jgi:hypothetical protein
VAAMHANNPVKKTEAPMPTNLFFSEGHSSNNG